MKTLNQLKALQAEAASKSVRPYYREKYAEWVREICKQIIETGNVLILPAVNISAATLKSQWYQGLAFLTEVLDPDFTPNAKRITATYDKRRGLIVALKVDPGLTAPVVYQRWKEDLQKWMGEATETGELFQKLGLALPDEDIHWLHDTMRPLEDMFAYDVDQKRGLINVVKL